MLTYEKARQSPKIFKAMAGMSPQQFDSLYAEVAKLYGEAEFASLNSKSRKRGVGAGRRFALDLRERLFMLLFYYRTYVTQILVGLLIKHKTISFLGKIHVYKLANTNQCHQQTYHRERYSVINQMQSPTTRRQHKHSLRPCHQP